MSVNVNCFDARHEMITNGRIWFHAMPLSTSIVVGVATGQLVGNEWLWVSDLMVYSEWRRQGVAGALLEFAERLAREDNLLGVCAGVKPTNAPSIALVESRGYAHVYTYDDGDRLYSLRFARPDA